MKKINLIALVLLGLIGFISADVGYGMMGGMMSGVYGYGGFFFSWIFSVLVLVVLVLLIIWLIKQIQKK